MNTSESISVRAPYIMQERNHYGSEWGTLSARNKQQQQEHNMNEIPLKSEDQLLRKLSQSINLRIWRVPRSLSSHKGTPPLYARDLPWTYPWSFGQVHFLDLWLLLDIMQPVRSSKCTWARFLQITGHLRRLGSKVDFKLSFSSLSTSTQFQAVDQLERALPPSTFYSMS